MYIDYVRSGGFAGIRLAGSFDTEKLPPDQAATLVKLIEGAGFFRLSEQIKSSSQVPDQFEYRITFTSAEQTHSVVVDESVIPASLRPLLDFLTTLVISSKKQ
jgi:hypothetical protein